MICNLLLPVISGRDILILESLWLVKTRVQDELQ